MTAGNRAIGQSAQTMLGGINRILFFIRLAVALKALVDRIVAGLVYRPR